MQKFIIHTFLIINMLAQDARAVRPYNQAAVFEGVFPYLNRFA